MARKSVSQSAIHSVHPPSFVSTATAHPRLDGPEYCCIFEKDAILRTHTHRCYYYLSTSRRRHRILRCINVKVELVHNNYRYISLPMLLLSLHMLQCQQPWCGIVHVHSPHTHILTSSADHMIRTDWPRIDAVGLFEGDSLSLHAFPSSSVWSMSLAHTARDDNSSIWFRIESLMATRLSGIISSSSSIGGGGSMEQTQVHVNSMHTQIHTFVRH